MKIVLADQNSGKELAFEEPSILIGRNADICQIVFEKELFPMVSRKHAEIHFEGGQWIISDFSSFGTFLNGQKINQSTPLQIASKIQIGQDGPSFIVIGLESAPKAPESLPRPIEKPPAAEIRKEIAQPIAQPNGIEAHIEFADGKKDPVIFEKNSLWIGRSPECDIVFESGKTMVSRKHASLFKKDGRIFIQDNKSFNGTLLNGKTLIAPTELKHGDEFQIGVSGPLLRLSAPALSAPNIPPAKSLPSFSGKEAAIEEIATKTMVAKAAPISQTDQNRQQLIKSINFGEKRELSIGRSEECDIRLDGLQISNRHARLIQRPEGIAIEDLGSTNGLFLNGNRISRSLLSPKDSLSIGSFILRIDGKGNVGIFDSRSKSRIDALNISKSIGKLKLLENISICIKPNEFIGLLGPSGAGKSLLMDALNGTRPAEGRVLINNIDLYRNFDSLKQSIGYVPQDEIIHRELTVYQNLYYVAKLRLTKDASKAEINQIVSEVLDLTGLAERRDTKVERLSGGQRKRVGIGVELITKPSVIFLDEPTSGLDPASDERIMSLFRQIAESGRTVILTTHAMESVKLFDKVVVMIRGKLAFYGKPDEALKYFDADDFKSLYGKLEAPIEEAVKRKGEDERGRIMDEVSGRWKEKFLKSPLYEKYISEPLKQLSKEPSAGKIKRRRLGLLGMISQFFTLSGRYWRVLFQDKLNLLILLAQAPLLALMAYLVIGDNQPRDFIYFAVSLVSIWFGTSAASREIVREKPIYTRERMFNLGILPYLASKVFVLSIIVSLQCFLFFAPLKMLDLAGAFKMPGELLGIPQFWAMLLTGFVGISIGLLVSALVKTTEAAASLIPLILIPQILFSGLFGVPAGISKIAGMAAPAAWSFDTMKRFSTLDTLEKDGAEAGGKTKGLGLYKFIESENDKLIADAKKDLDNYKEKTEKDIRDSFQSGLPPSPGDPPKLKDPLKIPEDLSGYVNFLHPWMHEILNQIVLMIMFWIFFIANLIVLRIKDVN